MSNLNQAKIKFQAKIFGLMIFFLISFIGLSIVHSDLVFAKQNRLDKFFNKKTAQSKLVFLPEIKDSNIQKAYPAKQNQSDQNLNNELPIVEQALSDTSVSLSKISYQPDLKKEVSQSRTQPTRAGPISVKLPDKLHYSKKPQEATTTRYGWSNIMSETFENGFPSYNNWNILNSPSWEERLHRVYSGTWSAWCAGTSESAYSTHTYPNNMNGWMIYGPFNLSDASQSQLEFYYWNKSESGYDYLQWLASTNGTNFNGYQISGDQSSWRSQTFDLTNVPEIGNLTGRSQVWIAFRFLSNGSITNEGAYLDNITLKKYVVPPFQTPSISSSDSYISPTSVQQGNSFTAYYRVYNPNSYSINVGLGESIRKIGDSGDGISNPNNDKIVSLPAGPGWSTQDRIFTISSGTTTGDYQYILALWSGTPGSSSKYSDTDWKSGLTVTLKPIYSIDSVNFYPSQATITRGNSLQIRIPVSISTNRRGYLQTWLYEAGNYNIDIRNGLIAGNDYNTVYNYNYDIYVTIPSSQTQNHSTGNFNINAYIQFRPGATGPIYDSQGIDATWSGIALNPLTIQEVPNNPPSLSTPTVTPNTGYRNTTFTYKVTYYDTDPLLGDPPTKYQIRVDNGSWVNMTKTNPLDNVYTDGVEYQYAKSSLGLGNHGYEIAFNDGKNNHVDVGFSGIGPNVVNQAPIINSGVYPDPQSGAIDVDINKDISWAGIFSDPDGDSLSYDVYFGTPQSNMTFKINTTSTSYDPGTLAYDTYYYWQIKAKDGYGGETPTSVWFFKTIVPNNPPTLSNLSISQTTGYIDTEFTFSVKYQDINNDAPTKYKLVIDGVSYDMIKDSLNSTYWAGVTYTKRLSGFSRGMHSYNVLFNDGQGHSDVTVPSSQGFTVLNRAPNQPTNPSPANVAIDVGINPTLSWSASDADNDTLSYDIYFGTSSTPPLKTNTSSSSYLPGMLAYNTSYYWQIKAKDGYGGETPGPIWSFKTKQEDLIVTHVKATDLNGLEKTMFEPGEPIQLHIYSNRGNNPITVNWKVSKPYLLFPILNHEETYYDENQNHFVWETNIPSSNLLGTYTFEGRIGESVKTQDIVINRKPTLYNAQVDPEIGTTQTEFQYSVYYKDLDNQNPEKIQTIITAPDGQIITKDMMRYSGTNTEGAYYTAKTTLPAVGNYKYYIYTKDPLGGEFQTPTYELPIVEDFNYQIKVAGIHQKWGAGRSNSIMDGYALATPGNHDGYQDDQFDGVALIKLKNEGNTRGSYRIYVKDQYLFSEQDDFEGTIKIEPKWKVDFVKDELLGGSWVDDELTFNVDPDHEVGILARLYVDSEIELGTVVDIRFAIESLDNPLNNIETNAVYSVVSSDDYWSASWQGLVDNIFSGATALYNFFIGEDWETFTDEDAEFHERLIAGVMLGTLIIPEDKAISVVIKATTTGGRKVARKVAIGEIEELAENAPSISKKALAKTTLEASEKNMIKHYLGRGVGKEFITKLDNLSVTQKGAMSHILRTMKYGDNTGQFVKNLNRFIDAEDVGKFIEKAALDSTDDMLFASERAAKLADNLVTEGYSVGGSLKLEKGLDLPGVGTVTPDAWVVKVKSGGIKEFEIYDFKNVEITEVIHIDRLKPAQIANYKQLIKQGVEGMSPSNARIIIETRYIQPGLEADLIRQLHLTEPTLMQGLRLRFQYLTGYSALIGIPYLAPVIITNAGQDIVTDSEHLILEGTTDAGANAILVNGLTQNVSYIPGNSSWRYEDTLAKGTYSFEIVSQDLDGATSEVATITVVIDPPPVILTNNGEDFITKDPNLTLEGIAETFFSQVLVNGSSNGVVFDQASGNWSYSTVLQEGDNQFVVAAKTPDDIESDPTTITITLDTQVPLVGADPEEGNYTEAIIESSFIEVRLFSDDPTAKIYYTLDGSDPIINSDLYNDGNPIRISRTTTIKFFALDPAGNRTETKTETYIVRTLSLNLTQGWNMVSVPSEFTDLKRFRDHPIIWRYNNTTQKYEFVTDKLVPDEGYLVYVDEAKTIEVPLPEFDPDDYAVKNYLAGWILASTSWLEHPDQFRIYYFDKRQYLTLNEAINQGLLGSKGFLLVNGSYQLVDLVNPDLELLKGKALWLYSQKPISFGFGLYTPAVKSTDSPEFGMNTQFPEFPSL